MGYFKNVHPVYRKKGNIDPFNMRFYFCAVILTLKMVRNVIVIFFVIIIIRYWNYFNKAMFTVLKYSNVVSS